MYSVYYWYYNEEILHGTTKHFGSAECTAQALSLKDGISEAFVCDEEGVVLCVYVDGNEIDIAEYISDNGYDEEQDPWAPYDYDDVDECGYNPYIGCNDDDC